MRLSFVVTFVILALAAAGQVQVPLHREGVTPGSQVFRFAGASLTEYAVLNAPFSCNLVRDVVKTAADGTRFTSQHELDHLCRDSEGRVRREQPLFGGVRQLVIISDLVTGYEYILDPDHSAAHRTLVRVAGAKPAPEIYQGRLQRALAAPVGATTRVTLGSQMIDGVYVEGMSYTTPLPTGALGSDRPFVITQERWVAPDLALCLLDKRSDPREGEITIRVMSLKREERDPTLFQVPADYTIIEESGPFQVIFVKPQRAPAAK